MNWRMRVPSRTSRPTPIGDGCAPVLLAAAFRISYCRAGSNRLATSWGLPARTFVPPQPLPRHVNSLGGNSPLGAMAYLTNGICVARLIAQGVFKPHILSRRVQSGYRLP